MTRYKCMGLHWQMIHFKYHRIIVKPLQSLIVAWAGDKNAHLHRHVLRNSTRIHSRNIRVLLQIKVTEWRKNALDLEWSAYIVGYAFFCVKCKAELKLVCHIMIHYRVICISISLHILIYLICRSMDVGESHRKRQLWVRKLELSPYFYIKG